MKKRPSIRNIANLITAGRVLLIPLLLAILYPWGAGGSVPGPAQSLWAGLLFGLAMLGDLADGYLARRRDEVTALGKLLDPLADKLMALSVLVVLIPIGWVPAWLVVIFLIRELAINSLRAAAAEEQVIIQASTLGKFKTAYKSSGILGALFHYSPEELLGMELPAMFHISFDHVGIMLLYVAAFVSVWSGIDYFVHFWRHVVAPSK